MEQSMLNHPFVFVRHCRRNVLYRVLALSFILYGPAAAESSSKAAVSPSASERSSDRGAIVELRSLIADQQRQLRQQQQQIDAQSTLLEKLLRKISEMQPAWAPPETDVLGKPAVSDSAAAPDKGVAAASTPSPAKETKPDPATFRAYWKQGLRFDTPDKALQLKVGGRILNDWGFFAPSSAVSEEIGPLEDGSEFRSTRLYVEGSLHKHVKFKSQFDFAGGKAGFKDMYLGLTKMPGVGNILVGHFKEPFGLEVVTSSKYITFMERALTSNISPGRNTGIMLQNAVLDDKMTWAFGTFRDAGLFGESFGNGGYNHTGRITALPWREDGGRRLLHLGLAYRRGNPTDNRLRYRARPSAHLTPRFVDTRVFSAWSTDTVGGEFALVSGPSSIQSEFVHSSASLPAGQRAGFTSFYVQGSFFLTGERRAYKSSTGVFDRIQPRRRFRPEGKGKGAWEIAGRYARIALNDLLIHGGELQDFTLGVNWYLNPNTRFMGNYVWAERMDLGAANLFQTRFQVDF